MKRHHTCLVDGADQGLDLVRVRAELLGELVEVGIGDRRKALLVDVLDDLDTEAFQRGGRCLFELKCLRGLLGADFRGGGLYPRLLVG